jgi:hypothetical protein
MLSSPVFVYTEPRSAKLQPRPEPPGALSRLDLFANSVIQLFYFQQLPDSFAQWTLPNSFAFNRLRTLSIAMGVYPSYYLHRAPIPFSELLHFPLSPHALCALSPKSVWELLCSQHHPHSFLKQPGVWVFATKFLSRNFSKIPAFLVGEIRPGSRGLCSSRVTDHESRATAPPLLCLLTLFLLSSSPQGGIRHVSK